MADGGLRWVVVDIFWLVVGGGGYILADSGSWGIYFGSWWVAVDIFWLAVGGSGCWRSLV